MSSGESAPDDVVGLGLQNERTRLAWSRTALSFAAAGGLLLHSGQTRGTVLGLASGAIVLACAVGTYLLGRTRYRNAVRAIDEGRSLSVPRLLGSVGAFTGVAAALALAVLVT